ncbi:type II toxin-antitoxin system death-on-curing family toxin [Candidatus Methylospira mobilis]|uniref:type II toxin-antitoxin system death-on-curing family toxin n=1 Tax=Candidatus Methylospira mobilis TaxID=1808979 RepID=UPI001D177A8A|nr:type II toxin-antitoxin system death-on-curing family toxin [Candidatus Methylospira mobilis]
MAAPPVFVMPDCWKPLYIAPKPDHADLIEEAAALWESLAQNHPFLDGNKRTAFAVMYTFLAVNGVTFTASAEETYAFIAGLYEKGAFHFDALALWLCRNTVRS